MQTGKSAHAVLPQHHASQDRQEVDMLRLLGQHGPTIKAMDDMIEGVAEGEDAVLPQFLQFLAHDMHRHSERVAPLGSSLVNRLQALVGDISIDLGQPLAPEDE